MGGRGGGTAGSGIRHVRVHERAAGASDPENELRRNTPRRPASRHRATTISTIIYATSGGSRADYYDSEGHVIRYLVTSPAAGRALFLSEAIAGEPRYRLSYELAAGGLLKGEFDVAPPGAPEAFKQYLTWNSRKVDPPVK